MPLDGLPGAPGRNAHDLVVIACRAARGEGVAQPEAVGFSHPVGDVGEGRRALVGGDDEIGIVPVMDHHALGMDHLAVGGQVVGNVQKTLEEGRIGAHPLGPHGIGAAALGQLLGIESALGAHGDDDGVLDLLGLYQTQDLGAEIITTVGPSQAAPGDRAEPQMDALHMGRPDEDLAIGLGQGQVGQFRGSDLEADIGFGCAVRAWLIVVCALDGADQQGDASQNPVLIQTFDRLQGLDNVGHFDGRLGLTGLEVDFQGWIEFGPEQLENSRGHAGVGREGGFLHPLAGIEPRLLTVPGQGADQRRLTPRRRQLQHQAVEAVILCPTLPDGREGLLEGLLHLVKHQMLPLLIQQVKVMDPDGPAADRADRKAGFNHGLQAHVFQDGQDIGQWRWRPGTIELEPELGAGVIGPAIGADMDPVTDGQGFQHL